MDSSVSRVGDDLQELVADVVPERVVDLLEPVQVEQQHRGLAVVPGGQVSASCMRSVSSARLGSPVRTSWVASCRSRATSWVLCSATAR